MLAGKQKQPLLTRRISPAINVRFQIRYFRIGTGLRLSTDRFKEILHGSYKPFLGTRPCMPYTTAPDTTNTTWVIRILSETIKLTLWIVFQG